MAKYSPAGQYLWSRQATGAKGLGVAVDGSANVIVTGSFYGTTDFGAGPITSPMGWAIFVTKYSAAGTALWSKSAGGWTDAGNAVATDAAGNVIVTGQFGNWLNFGTGWLLSRGNNDIFLAKFAPSGTPVWVKSFGNVGFDFGSGVVVDRNDNVLATGIYGSLVDFGGGTLFSNNGSGMFVAKFSPTGTHIWSEGSFGGAVAIDGSGDLAVAGSFGGTVNFGSGPLTSAGDSDIFLLSRAP